MKIRAFVVLALIACGILSTVFIVQANRASCGEMAITEAIQAKDTPLLIKSLITKMKGQLEKDSDTFPELIKEVEKYAGECPDSASVAVLHSMIAEMYQTYYNQNRWNINSRTNLAGYVPEDIREWTSNLFQNKIQKELEASLQPARLLQETPISKFDAILEKGKNTQELRPTLYDFLAFRAIDMQPDTKWYNDLLAFRRTQPDKKVLLLDELAYYQYLYYTGKSNLATYQNVLDSLLTVYQKDSYAAAIQTARTELLQRERFQGNQTYQDSVQNVLYNLCKETIARYPQYERINIVKMILAQMEMPVLNVQAGNNVYPGKPLSLQIKYTNTPKLTVSIYKSLRQPELAWKTYPNNGKSMRGVLVKQQTIDMRMANTYTQMDTTLTIPMDKLGLYEYVIAAPDKQITASGCFSISRLGTLVRSMPDGAEVLVTDLESGKPVDGAHIIYYKTNQMNGSLQQKGEAKTNHHGLATLPDKQDMEMIRPVLREDSFSIASTIYGYGRFQPSDQKENIQLSVFTDRGIYRPGQSVFFKGIAYVVDTDNPHVVANRSYTVILRDANYKEIVKKEFKTDKFGSFNGEFTIPAQTLSGSFSLTADRSRTSIRVEEYKRPSFKVDIEPLREEVSFGKPVQLEGLAQTFSGLNLQAGEVKWEITRRPFWLRYYMYNPFDFTYQQVASGTSQVDSKGNFTLSFVPERPASTASGFRPTYQSYEVVATLTDSKGETQEARYTFSVGDTGILLTVKTPEDEMERDSAKAEITAYTVNRQPVRTEGIYTLYSLEDSKPEQDALGRDRYKVSKQVATGTFTTENAIPSSVFSPLPAGRYRLEVKSKDKSGRDVSADSDFILYSRSDKRPPVFMHTWLVKERTACLPGEDAEFVFGTSDKNAHILYEVFNSETKCIERKYIVLNNENRKFRIPFKETDGNGFSVSFTFVKEGKMYTTEVPVYRRQPDRKLNIYAETFRNHLLPGSKETWKFRVTDKDSVAVSAQVLASMYDASLDKILPFNWAFSPTRFIYLNAPRFTEGSAFTDRSQYETGKMPNLKITEYQYDRINWQDVLSLDYQYRRRNGVSGTGAIMMKSQAAPVMDAIAESAVRTYAPAGTADIIAEEEVESDGPALFTRGLPDEPIQLRDNFAETAFFYPVLVTDGSGDIAFSFTMPESNTTWKLQLLAQTEDLKYGYLSKEVITNKPLMVTPNLPRFLRQGDVVTISSQVSNQSGTTVSGRTSFELFDPSTDQPVVCLTKSQKLFTLTNDSTTTVSWSFTVPTSINGVVGCRITAESDKGSDGEQHLIPVLSNQILVTESTPFYLFDKNEQVIRLKDEKGIKPFRLTLEMTANPIWYAVQALPTLTQPDHDNIISWFASYYSNTLANHIAASHPRIKKMIDLWKAQGGTASTLYSNLEKDTELKNILLQETPWVLAADNETEQMQRLSLLFDLNRANAGRETALQKLIEQQLPDGGWSWFKGMFASREITLHILKGMSQLVKLNAIQYNQQEKEMQIKALNYLDKQIQQDYESLKQNNPNWQKSVVSPIQLEYLFVRSEYRDIPELGDAREAIRFYTAQTEKQWDKQNLQGKAETAWLMWRNGKKEVTDKILTWFRKTATVSTDKGMYWANNRNSESFFVSPLDTHCLLMALFNELSPNKQDTDRMKQWLLSHKQTQNWETVPATVNAIYALLLTGGDWLAANNTCTAQWGGKTYSTANGETATGYLKIMHSSENSVSPQWNNISITKEGSAPAWGAVYEQFFQDINQVKKQKGVLNIEKMLFVQTNNGTENELRPVTADQPLKVGDQVVVRLVIRSDRAMDYVFLKDLRPGCFEPTNQLSGSMYKDGVWYYQSPTDVSENFFFSHLPQGTFVLEYSTFVSHIGEYAGGISTIQCLYAPEFVSHTGGNKLSIK